MRTWRLLLGAVVAVGVAGCGGDEGTKGGDAGAPDGSMGADVAPDVSESDVPDPDAASGPDTGGDAAPAPDAEPDVAAEEVGADVEEDVATFPANPPTTVHATRPAKVYRPRSYDPSRAYPLVILFHGYGANGGAQNLFLGTSSLVDALDYVLVVPDGTENAEGKRYWNATPACCAFGDGTVDDVAYFRELVRDTGAVYRIDADRVYAFGHSNGGFLSYRLACEASDVLVAMASLAGASFADASRCAPATEPVSVLQIHGTKDDTIRYEGGATILGAEGAYPGAEASVRLHAEVAGCDLDASEAGPNLNVETSIPGDESTTRAWRAGCARGTEMALWTIPEGVHIPSLRLDGTRATLAWLLERRRR